jgi:hypothetical protein
MLLEEGEIPDQHIPLLREKLRAAKGSQGEELLKRLALPFEKRFGDYGRSGRGSHLSIYEV